MARDALTRHIVRKHSRSQVGDCRTCRKITANIHEQQGQLRRRKFLVRSLSIFTSVPSLASGKVTKARSDLQTENLNLLFVLLLVIADYIFEGDIESKWKCFKWQASFQELFHHVGYAPGKSAVFSFRVRFTILRVMCYFDILPFRNADMVVHF